MCEHLQHSWGMGLIVVIVLLWRCGWWHRTRESPAQPPALGEWIPGLWLQLPPPSLRQPRGFPSPHGPAALRLCWSGPRLGLRALRFFPLLSALSHLPG